MKDFVASALTELPPSDSLSVIMSVEPEPLRPVSPDVSSPVLHHRFINSSKNVFGLFRRYFGKSFPTHDPEGQLNLESLVDLDTADEQRDEEPICTNQSFYPYPNSSSFQLSDWYWTDGSQKSRSSFRNLVDIITSPERAGTLYHSARKSSQEACALAGLGTLCAGPLGRPAIWPQVREGAGIQASVPKGRRHSALTLHAFPLRRYAVRLLAGLDTLYAGPLMRGVIESQVLAKRQVLRPASPRGGQASWP